MNNNNNNKISSVEWKLIIATLICILFMVGEIIGGYISGSIAIITDALHLLADVSGFIVSLFCLFLTKKDATKVMSFGFKRAEVIGALISVLIIWLVTGILLYEAINRTISIIQYDNKNPVDGKIMFIVACLGLVCNLIIMKVLGHGHSHDSSSHSHTHNSSHSHKNKNKHESKKVNINDENEELLSSSSSPGYEINGLQISYGTMNDFDLNDNNHDKRKTNININAAYIHALGDLIQSIGVIIAGGIIWLIDNKKYPLVQLADPIATFLFSILVLFSTISMIKTSLHILMQGSPENVDIERIRKGLLNLKHVTSIHDFHIWDLSLNEPFLSVHLVIDDTNNKDNLLIDSVLANTQHFLRLNNITHSTIQIEKMSVKKCTDANCKSKNCNHYALCTDKLNDDKNCSHS